jgi:carboxylesterase type B
VDELSALVLNIVIPQAFQSTTTTDDLNKKPLPVFVYIHGGSLLYGGGNLPIFDAVNLVSHSITTNQPIICINFNYRVGLGGFLGGSAIASSLAKEGHSGSGNFGLTDQQTAFAWVQKYIHHFGGDASNVTAVGESAGGISISNHLLAARPATFHRAVCMSGLAVSIPAWTIAQHDRLFEAVCAHFDIDSRGEGVVDKLRAIPQQDLADATPLIQGVPSGTGNPCIDGWFYPEGLDHGVVHAPPGWLQSLMIGDTYHEGVIFHLNLVEGGEDFASVRRILQSHIQDESVTDLFLREYEIADDLSRAEFLVNVEHMCGDAIFKIPNYVLAQICGGGKSGIEGRFYSYHFDQRSRIRNSFEGTAYHAHELLYLFGNLENEMNYSEREMVKEFMSAWIRFANGLAPWHPKAEERWMVWGPDSKSELKNEAKDEDVRGYERIKRILGLGDGTVWKKWLAGVDSLVVRRWKLEI